MKCEDLQFNLPVYFDNVLTGDELAAADEHLLRCPLCRQKLSEYQTLRRDLRVLPRPELPNELMSAVQNRVAQKVKADHRSIFTEDFRRWLQMRLMPYSVGTAASLLIGFSVLWVLLFSPNYSRDFETAKNMPNKQTTTMLTDADPLMPAGDVELSAADFAAARISVSGDSPSLNPQGALVALTKSIVRGKMKDDEVVVVADVFGSGLAKIAAVVEPSKDINAVRELEKALKTNPDYAPPFVPAKLDQRSDTVRVIFKIQSVNVDTHLKK